jgi:cell division protein ZapA
MAQVQIAVNGRSYQITCDDGQETHVARLGRYLDQKVGTLVKSVGQVGDARLLVMAGLLIADELVETDQALVQARNDASAAANAREQVRASFVPSVSGADEGVLAEALERLAMRIEGIAAGLEQDQVP